MGTKVAASKKNNKKLNKKKKGKVMKTERKKISSASQSNEENQNVSAGEDAESDASSVEMSDCEEYEKNPRLLKTIKLRNLLPVKSKKGLLYRSEVVKDQQFDAESSIQDVNAENSTSVRQQSLVQRFVTQRKKLDALKQKIALLCTSIIEDPQSNIIALKELITSLQNPTTDMIVSEKRILCFSLVNVFVDILPGYKIRPPGESDNKVQLKKETKKLVAFETNLLKYYKKYLDHLNDLIRDMKLKTNLEGASQVKIKAVKEIGFVAVKCMCELLYSNFNFNFFKNICNKLVPLVLEDDDELVNMVCLSFEKMFKADTRGEAAFELVNQIVHFIKARKFVVPPALLRSFQSLNLREARVNVEKVDMTKGRQEWRMMSRTERRNKKKLKDLEAELKEAEAHESVENVKKYHTQTLNKVFWVFFHILKDADKITLIAPALEGLSRFAYLINLEFFDDLNTVLCSLMESGKLSDIDKLHSVYTLFTILAGQAESLHIDPHKIYCHMYQGLLNLNHYTNVAHYDLVLKCLEFNILRKRKKISSSRVLAFTKRISTVSLHTPFHASLGLLSAVRNILLNVKSSDILLDSESLFGNGIYLPEMEDPEHCNATSTRLWEFHILKKHFNPVVRLYSQYLLHGCPTQGRLALPEKLLKATPEETLNMFADIVEKNKFDFLEDADEPPKKKFKFDDLGSFSYEQNISLDISKKEVKNVNFRHCLSV
ncbi:nucleolar complex protein 3 homolog [Uloborus diversus]|uniref:nucleolar complex protein 3 homolog n=1 Tax=Uloborus diversus TaxID=327109 RepID=UPI002409E1EA|nr:nucleolar complex protein 3 homolog [Uloborus diversus]